MRHSDAEYVFGLLVGGTPGWSNVSDVTIGVYMEQIGRLTSYEMACEAVNGLIQTWTENRRPPVAVVREAYRSSVRRHEMAATPALPSGDRYPAVAEGRKIAAAAYAGECKRQGREPNWSMFDSLVGSVGP